MGGAAQPLKTVVVSEKYLFQCHCISKWGRCQLVNGLVKEAI